MGVGRRATDSAPTRYRPRRPSQGVLYRCVQEHLESWLAQCRDGHHDDGPVPPYVEREFRRYLDCGILDHLGEPTAPPRIAPARGPPLWDAVSAEHEPTLDPALLPTPAFEFDQRLTW